MQPVAQAGWVDDLRLSRAMQRHAADKKDNADSRYGRSADTLMPRESAEVRTHRVFDERQRTMHDEFTTQARRVQVAEERIDASNVDGPFGSARGSLKEVAEIEAMLAQRLRRIEETVRAISNASEVVDGEAGMARARAEAEAWAKGNATTRRLASGMPANEVCALVNERNELRVQVRRAAAELHKIKMAAGGDPVDVVRFCQDDMERVAKLRAAVELELENLKIKLVTTRDELDEATQQGRVNNVRILTYEQQMAERANTVVSLQNQLEAAKIDLEKARVLGEQGVHDAVRSQHTRMLEEHRIETEGRVTQLRDEASADKRAALELQRAMLEEQGANRLEENLAEQHHVLVAQLNKEMQTALADLQRDLNDRCSRQLEALRNDMQHEREQAVAALEQRLRTVQNRGAKDLEEARSLHEIALENSLDEQKQRLVGDALAEKKASLEKLESMLTNRHKEEMYDLRSALDKRVKESTSAGIRKAKDQLQKKFESDFTTQRHRVLREQAERLNAEKAAELKKLHVALDRKTATEVKAQVKKELKTQEERLSRELASQRIKEVERVSTVARGDKTSALSALRERMEQQHAMDTEKLKAEIRTLSEESRKLRHGKAQTVESLRSGQRKELAEMKESMKSRKDKHISKKVAPLEDEVARLVEQVADLKRVQANSIERALAEHRVAKTREIDNLRARLEDKRATDVEELEAKVAQLSQANRELKRQGTLDTGKNQLVRKATAKASSSLRDMLRRLLNEMRIALVPRQHAPLDSSEASPSAAMGRLQVLIKCLGREIPDMTGLPEATREATEAPPVAVDVLLGCSGELCAALHGMVEEINGLHIEMSRDWKVLRKKVEDELHAEFNAKLQQMQTRMSRQLQAAGDTTAVTLDRQHSKEKERHHAEMDKEMRDFKLDMAGKKEQMKEQMQQAFDTHVAGLQERVQKTEEENEAMIDALIAETDQLKGEVERKDDYVKEVLSEMESLAEERDRLRQQLEANPRYLSPPGVANSNSSLSLSPNHDMYDGHGIDELERMRLEKRISNLQAAVEQLMESGSSFGSPMPPPPP